MSAASGVARNRFNGPGDVNRKSLTFLVDWSDREATHVNAEMKLRFRECCQLLGVPIKYAQDISVLNLQRKATYLRERSARASKTFGQTLLKSREFEDTSDFEKASQVFERYARRSRVPFYVQIAKAEIRRIKGLANRSNSENR